MATPATARRWAAAAAVVAAAVMIVAVVRIPTLSPVSTDPRGFQTAILSLEFAKSTEDFTVAMGAARTHPQRTVLRAIQAGDPLLIVGYVSLTASMLVLTALRSGSWILVRFGIPAVLAAAAADAIENAAIDHLLAMDASQAAASHEALRMWIAARSKFALLGVAWLLLGVGLIPMTNDDDEEDDDDEGAAASTKQTERDGASLRKAPIADDEQPWYRWVPHRVGSAAAPLTLGIGGLLMIVGATSGRSVEPLVEGATLVASLGLLLASLHALAELALWALESSAPPSSSEAAKLPLTGSTRAAADDLTTGGRGDADSADDAGHRSRRPLLSVRKQGPS